MAISLGAYPIFITHVPMFHSTQPLDSMIGINGLLYNGYYFGWCPIYPFYGTFNNPWWVSAVSQPCGPCEPTSVLIPPYKVDTQNTPWEIHGEIHGANPIDRIIPFGLLWIKTGYSFSKRPQSAVPSGGLGFTTYSLGLCRNVVASGRWVQWGWHSCHPDS